MENTLLSISALVLTAITVWSGLYFLFEGAGPRSDLMRSLKSNSPGRDAQHARRPKRSERAATALALRLNLKRWLGLDEVRERLAQAGKRKPSAESVFLLMRLSYPVFAGVLAAVYVFGLKLVGPNQGLNALIVIGAVLVGFKLPEISLNQDIKKRRAKIRAAWPDALDLTLIILEAGKSLDQAFRQVADEIEPRSKELAEELHILLAERAFLSEPRQAYENFGSRIGLPEVKSTCVALIQAEEQGSPMGKAFRVLARQGRETRLHEATERANKIAAFLPAVGIVFFLFPMLAMALFPMIIQTMEWR